MLTVGAVGWQKNRILMRMANLSAKRVLQQSALGPRNPNGPVHQMELSKVDLTTSRSSNDVTHQVAKALIQALNKAGYVIRKQDEDHSLRRT